ncbi:MAG: dihydrodipicolinate synthase family protein [Candidatus Sumerlaeaceae bacterium]
MPVTQTSIYMALPAQAIPSMSPGQTSSSAPIFAVVTPFNSGDDVDHGALRDYLLWLHSNGVTRVVVCGTTGEFPSLTLAERRAVIETARAAFSGEVIAHASSCSVSETREMIAHARDFSDAVLLLPPYYFADVTQEGVREFFMRIAGDCPLPVYLYNFPRHTQFNIKPALLQRLQGDLPMLRGIKDSGGKWDQAVAYKQAQPRLQVIVGSDGAALRVLKEGLDGSVTGGASPVPQLMTLVHSRFVAGDQNGAESAQKRLDEWTIARKSAGVHEIALVKAVLSRLIFGFPAHVRTPLMSGVPKDFEPLVQLARDAGNA